MMNKDQLISSIPFADGCKVISFDDSGIVAIYKKSGRSTHPNLHGGKSIPMINAKYNFKEEYYSWENILGGENIHLHLVNRLDSPTSGIVIASFSKEIADKIKLLFKEKKVKKTYYAICLGRVFQKFGTWRDRIESSRTSSYVRSKVSDDSSGRLAITEYEIERSDDNGAKLNLVKLMPLTGLTHQLRVQCSRRRMHILGDATYGDFAKNRFFSKIYKLNRLFLHCAKTEFELEGIGKFSFESPLPKSFNKVLDYNVQLTQKFNPLLAR